jgi:MFS family permease
MAQYLRAFDIDPVTVGSVIGVMSITSMVIRPFCGWICDRLNKRLLLVVFTGMIALILLCYGLADNAAVFYLLRTLHGAAFSVTTTVTMAFVAEYIPKNRLGEGMGYFGLGLSIAAAIGPSAALTLALCFGGVSVFFAASSIMLVGFGLIFMMKPMRSGDVEASAVKKTAAIRPGDFIAIEALPYAVITVALSASNGIEAAYIASYAESLGIPNIGWYFTLSAVTMFAARLLLGKITDKKGFIWVLIPGILLVTLALVILSFANGKNAIPMFAAAAVMKACGVGALQPGIQAMSVQSVPSSRRGAASSTYYIGADLGQGASVIAAGKLVSDMGYSPMFGLYTLPLLSVLALYPLMRRTQKKYITKRGST